MRGSLGVHALALAACIGLDVPVLAQDNSGLVAGKDAWARASCFNCHGSMAQGGSGGDYPVGPTLRNITFGKETMVEIVSCGIPGTRSRPTASKWRDVPTAILVAGKRGSWLCQNGWQEMARVGASRDLVA